MPFAKKGAAGLTERLDVRVAPAEKVRLRDLAAVAGVPVAELVRARALGRPVVPRTDRTTIRELRRLGGLLKKVHLDSHGAYRAETAAALADPPRRHRPPGRRRRRRGVIVKKIPPSKMAAPKTLAANVRALADYIAGPRAGGDGEKVEHRGGLNFLAIDHDGQVQEMIDLAEVARRDAEARPALDPELARGRAAHARAGRRGGRDVPRRDGPGRPPGHLRAS